MKESDQENKSQGGRELGSMNCLPVLPREAHFVGTDGEEPELIYDFMA